MPFDRLPLWAMASTLPPVFSSKAAIHFQRSRGLSLPGGSVVKGTTWRANLRVVAEDDVAVEVVAAGVRRPFIADEGGEAARLVGLLRRVDGLLPGRAVGRGVRRDRGAAA